MKKIWFAFWFCIVVIFLLFLAWEFWDFGLKKEPGYNYGKVCINNNCFEVQLAQNNFQIKKGLMFRENLAENMGMLFIFEKSGLYPFWMKNTKIPLDIIWISTDNKIIYISDFTQPCTTLFCPKINPNKNAKYVLEINAGLCQKLNIKIGDQIKISN